MLSKVQSIELLMSKLAQVNIRNAFLSLTKMYEMIIVDTGKSVLQFENFGN